MGCALRPRATVAAWLGACAALFLGSFGDEAAQIAFALRLADGGYTAPAQVSALLAAGLLGGIFAAAIAPRALNRFGARRLIVVVFVAEAVLIACASFASTFPWFVAIAAVLGCLGSLLWSAVLVALPALALSQSGIARANRVVQTVRNLGYVVGPLLGSALFAWSSGPQGLLCLAAIMLLAAIGVAVTLPSLVASAIGTEREHEKKRSADVIGLLRTPGVLRAIAPLVITVLVTSALNVLLIVRIRADLGLSAATYGVVVAALSAGLVIGPLLFAKPMGRLGDAAGASIGAAIIGAGIVVVGAADIAWELAAAATVIGVANGVQNTLMSGFIINRVDAARRTRQMPAYILILQCAVLAGFVCAAFIHVDAAAPALIAVGAVAVAVGSVGALVNVTNKQKPIEEGASL